jgi:predicted DNA-binding transcriptional regulator AlpA
MTEEHRTVALNLKHIVNTEAAAHLLNVSAVTLAKWRVTGEGPRFLKFGRSVKYRISDLEEWIQDQQRESTAEYKQAC